MLTRWAATVSLRGLRTSSHHRPVERHHADQRLRVELGELAVVPAGLELRPQDVLDLVRDVVEDRGEVAGRGADRGFAHEHPETVSLLLDVVEQRQRRLLQQLARVTAVRAV